jgi:DNA (cytosine-5)-methyltransferase 1
MPDGRKRQVGLEHQVRMTEKGLWPTPQANDAKGTGPVGSKSHTNHLKRKSLLSAAAKMWPTPKATPSGPDYARMNRKGSGGDDLATAVARKKMLPTPTAADAIKQGKVNPRPGGMGLSETTGGQLNPTWVEWLQGYPLHWTKL